MTKMFWRDKLEIDSTDLDCVKQTAPNRAVNRVAYSLSHQTVYGLDLALLCFTFLCC